MSEEATTAIPSVCPNCGGTLTHPELCPRCLIGDVLAVVDGPTPPRHMSSSATGARKVIGEYELLEELGRGGMGVVWKAKQRRLNRIVALKLVRGGCLPGEAAAKRFRREAEAAAQLKHPNIVVIHEVGESDDQLFLSMDLVEGGSLADWVKRVAFSPRDAAVLVSKVARGVHHAHENQVLHRDLKPGNILLDASGEPRVCDFGLARLGDSESSLTISGELLGTPAYLSPEQAAGKMRDLTPASDTYSLGAILYELLCGHPPFSADNLPALLRKVAEDDPMRPLSHFSGGRIPFDLSTICLKCLEKEPTARYESSLALAEDLERWLRGEPIVARPVARVERVWKWVRRKPVLAALWLVITGLLIVVAVVASVMSYRLERERRRVAALAEESKFQVARQHSESAQRYMGEGDYLRALPALAEAISIGTGDARLDEADRIRFGVLLRSSPQLTNMWLNGQNIARAEATLDGNRLFTTTEATAEVWNVSTGQRVGTPLALGGPVSNAQFDTVTGRWALLEVEGKLSVWEPDTGTVRSVGQGQIFTPPDAYLQRTPNFIAYHRRTAEVRSLATGERIAGPFEHQVDLSWATILPGLNRALTADLSGMVHLWDLTTGKVVFPPIPLGKLRRAINFDTYHPEQKLAAMHREKECWLLNCETGAVVVEHDEVDDSPQTIGWDEKGEWVFLARNNDGLTLRKMHNDTIRWYWPHNALGFRGSFAPATSLVATQSWNGSARVWRMSNGRPVSPFVWQTATPASCILDPRGRWLMTRGDEPAGRLWTLREGEGSTAFPELVDKPKHAWLAHHPERYYVTEENGRVRGWEVELPRRKTGEAQHPEAVLQWAGASANGDRFFTAGPRMVRVWDGTTWMPYGKTYESESELRYVTMDATGQRLALVHGNGKVEVWDVATGAAMVTFDARASQVAFSPDGRLILALAQKETRTWDAFTGQPVSPPVQQPDGSVHARFSPDGRSVLQWTKNFAPGQFRARIWDAATGRITAEMAPHWLGVSDAAWSPDGKLVVTGGEDQTLLLCDALTGSSVLPPIKHSQKISAVGLSSDGLLMWSLADKEITIWHAVTGEAVAPRMRQVRTPISVMMTGDGRDLLVAGERSAPRIWNLHPDLRPAEELRSIAHAMASHALVTGTSALRPLSLVELRAAWETARKSLGSW
jgi:WD40 repeat protein